MELKREYRTFKFSIDENRAAESNGRLVEGYAALFNTQSDGLPFIEIIDAGAFDGVIVRSDVLAVLNHNPELGLYARSKHGKGSLKLMVDEKGLRFSFEALDNDFSNTLLQHIRANNLSECSFSFSVELDEWSSNQSVRHIKKIRELFDISIVYNAAYSKTSVTVREEQPAQKEPSQEEDNTLSNTDLINEKIESDNLNEIESLKQLDSYYSELDAIINKTIN